MLAEQNEELDQVRREKDGLVEQNRHLRMEILALRVVVRALVGLDGVRCEGQAA
jgi:hypothetical protein